jgi:hypothetical protein
MTLRVVHLSTNTSACWPIDLSWIRDSEFSRSHPLHPGEGRGEGLSVLFVMSFGTLNSLSATHSRGQPWPQKTSKQLSIGELLAHLSGEGSRWAACLPSRKCHSILKVRHNMQYMLMYYETPAELARRDDPAQAPAYWGAWQAYMGALVASGCMVSGAGLEPPRSATTVRVSGGKRQVQDGPFADTREHLGGFFVVEATSLDGALEWAARAPCAGAGGVEVRPVLPPPAA